MTGVWESLIPETPSTEPLTLPPLSPDEPISVVITCPSPTNNYYRNKNNAQSQDEESQETGGYEDLKTVTCDNNNLISSHNHDIYSPESHPTNHNSTPERRNKSRNEGDTDKTSFHRLTSSIHCPDQFWRFYSDRFEERRRDHVEGTEGGSPKRTFLKTGVYNTRTVNVFQRTQRYIRDIFTTLVDSKWRWTLVVFTLSYILSWLGFTLLWFLIVYYHGDLEDHPGVVWEPCVVGVKSFASIFLFSLETQHTIGYGTRFINDNCPDAILVLIIQSITGILIEAFVVGVVFAKVSRPKKRSQTLVFSKNAVICGRDGKNYLMVRVGDLRNRSSLFEAHVRAQVITKRVTQEGEVIPIHQQEIKVGGYGEDEDRLLLFWPTIVVHRIDSESPFYSLSASDMNTCQLELIMVLEGVVESTGMTTQLRTSYIPQEILWGRRFRELSSHKNETGRHIFDFELFNDTFPLDGFPLCSARDLYNIQQHNNQSPHPGVGIGECGVKGGNESQHPVLQPRTHIELTLMNGMGQVRRASIDSYDDYQDHNHRTGHGHLHSLDNSSEDEEGSSEDSESGQGRKICHLGLPGIGKKRKRERSSTCTCSTNLSDSNV